MNTPLPRDGIRRWVPGTFPVLLLLPALPSTSLAQGVVAVGDNSFGQCNVVPAPTGLSYAGIAAGETHAAARLSDGALLAWGDNSASQCTLTSPPPGLLYVQVSAGSAPLSLVPFPPARPGWTIGLRSDGAIDAWGDTFGQGTILAPAPPQGETFEEVDAGYGYNLARLSDGTVLGWESWPQASPLVIPPLPPGMRYKQISAGGAQENAGSPAFAAGFALAVRSDGAVVAWGAGIQQLSGVLDVPPLPPGLTYVEVSAGQHHAVARLSDGSLVSWGSGPTIVPPAPVGTTYTSISAGFGHTVALLTDGSVVAWGDNSFGQCDIPPPPPGQVYVEVTAGSGFTLARHAPVCAPVSTYCTGKLNSAGCTPSISMSIAPKVGSLWGCTVATTQLVGESVGILLHSISGPAATPFHGGHLCLTPPVKRHTPRATGGHAGMCDGMLVEDLNEYIFRAYDPALVLGTQVWIQCWARDPGDVLGDSLSNAVTSTLCP